MLDLAPVKTRLSKWRPRPMRPDQLHVHNPADRMLCVGKEGKRLKIKPKDTNNGVIKYASIVT